MKRHFLHLHVLAALCVLSASFPRSSEAGLIITGAGGVMWINDNATGGTDRMPDDLRLMLYGGAIAVVGGVLWLVGAKVTGTVILVLDESGNASADTASLAAELSHRFPEIEDGAVLRELSKEIIASGFIPRGADSARIIRLEKTRVQEILAPLGFEEMNPARYAAILGDLT